MHPEEHKTEKPIRTLLRRIGHAITHRPFMKLSALLIAFILWAVLLASDPTLTIEKTILNAPVTISGQETLRSKGLTVINDLSSVTVKMRAEVRISDYDAATAETLNPRLELSQQITQEGTSQRIYFTASPSLSGSSVIAFEPEYITVDVETYKSNSRVPVVIEYAGMSGEINAPLWIDTNASTDPSQVTVSGPQSIVDQVYRAVVTLPLDGLTPDRPQDQLTSRIELRDAQDNPVPTDMLRITADSINIDTARIYVDVYAQRHIPVDTASAVTGIPAHGYALREVRINPETVSVAAETSVLETLEALYVSAPLDITGLSESTTAALPLRSVAGVKHIPVQEVTIEVDIGPAEHVHVYNNLPVAVIGIDPDYDLKLSHDQMDLIVRGDYDAVQGLTKEDLTLYIDATGLGEGVHMLDVKCIANGTTDFTYEPELPRVTLTLTQNTQDGTE